MGRQIKYSNSLLPRSCRDMLSIVESFSKQNSIKFCICTFILRCPVVTSTKGVLFNFQVRVPYPVLFQKLCFWVGVTIFVLWFSHDNLLVTNYIQKEYLQCGYLKVMDFFFVDIRFVEIIILSPPGLVLVFISSRFTLPLLPILSPFKNGLKRSRKAVLDYRLVMKEKTLV